LKTRIVLNGCSLNYAAQSNDAKNFLSALPAHISGAQTIIFYSNPDLQAILVSEAPTSSLHLVNIDYYEPETALSVLEELESPDPADLYLFPGDLFGSELAARFACRLNGTSLVSVEKIQLSGDKLICFKTVYGNYLQGAFKLSKKPYCLSLARGLSGNNSKQPVTKPEIKHSEMTGKYLPDHILERRLSETETGRELDQARFILAGGRGVKGKTKVIKLQESAAEMGARLGVSRPVAMNGWAPLDKLIGASGAITKPDLCLAVAVSGSAAFYIGIEKSKRIIAVNIDARAPIIEGADLAVIDDYEAVLESLLSLIRKNKD
jgi:electron transfer flavoprotein alpha subunit